MGDPPIASPVPAPDASSQQGPRNASELGALILRQARRFVVLVVGLTLLVIGVIMLVTPGPAFVVIPLGLAILGLEFAWARSWLKRIRSLVPGLEEPDVSKYKQAEEPGLPAGDRPESASNKPVTPQSECL